MDDFFSQSWSLPVSSLITREPVFVSPETSAAQAARTMQRLGISSVLVKGEDTGILTDRDLRHRILAAERPPDTPVEAVCTRPLRTLTASAPLSEALRWMLTHNVHHIPLTQQDEIVGVLTDSDLLRRQLHTPFHLQKRLQHDEMMPLQAYAPQLLQVVQSLQKSDAQAHTIARFVSLLNDTLLRRLLQQAEAALGAPPTPYAWVVFGSEGRMEQTLLTDQDNALVFLEDHPAHREYFGALTAQVVEGLQEAGFPLCPGGYMATQWCEPLTWWQEQFATWIQKPDPEGLLLASIFFDMRKVHGTLDLAPLLEVLATAAQTPAFLRQVALSVQQARPPLGWFGRLRTQKGMLNLKAGGLFPLVGIARLHALAAGLQHHNTLDRLEAAAQDDTLDATACEELSEAFRFLLHLRLQLQTSQLSQLLPLSNSVALRSLSHLQKRRLKEAFTTISQHQDALALRYRTSTLS